ncbi:hypothetical protein [Catenovulum sediminis]|uniref:hypothetical protein n=1 Tax=Catenovulum sediminis TaxID=1740262 RepID=UPI00117FB088|nr:hypothetical protein [Catenovulum sediminis]
MALKYQYAPDGADLVSNTTDKVAGALTGCILFMGESAADLRPFYNPNAGNLVSDSMGLVTLLNSVASDVVGAGGGPKYLLQGQTKQSQSVVSRPIVVTQLENGVPKQVGYGHSRAVDGGFTLGIYANTDNAVIATSWQNFGQEFVPASLVYSGDVLRPTSPNGFVYHAINSGTLGAAEPEWPTIEGDEITSGNVTLQAVVYYQPVSHAPIDIVKNYVSGEFPAEIRQADACPVFDPDSFELSTEVRAMFA